MWSQFDLAAVMLVLAAAIGVANELTLRLPRPVALLLGALVVSAIIIGTNAIFVHSVVRERLHDRLLHGEWPKLLLDGVLAMLLFAGSLHVDLPALRRRVWTVAVLATIAVVFAAGLFAAGVWALLNAIGAPVPFAWCLAIGAILAPTDAVAVEGLLAKVSLPPALRTMITGESLFNDGAAVALFVAALALASGRSDMIGHGRLTLEMAIEIGGGVALGVAAGFLACRVMRLSEDMSLAVTISFALVFSSYRGALALGVSGPIAVVAAGLALSYGLARATGADQIAALSTFWARLDDVLNALLYMLIGFAMLAIDFDWRVLLAMLAAIPLALLARLVSVGAPMLILDRQTPDIGRAIGMLTWAGLRGGISIALALVLPESPYRNLLLTICFGVVIFTVIVQGVLLPRVVKALYGAPAKGANADAS